VRQITGRNAAATRVMAGLLTMEKLIYFARAFPEVRAVLRMAAG
jgi:hypothetical protein